MAMISQEDKERVRQATDFKTLVSETVELRQRGRDFWGCCPFHHEKSPSFHIMPETGLWKCFGCGEGGDVFDYVMKREGLEFPDAIRYLADRANIELHEDTTGNAGPKRNRLLDCLAEAESFYKLMLMRGKGQGAAKARKYLSERRLGSDVAKRWNLGYAPGNAALVTHLKSKGFTRQEMEAADLATVFQNQPADRFYNRVMFPIHDEMGRTIAFGGRVMGDAKPKYLNSKETRVFHKGKNLFAFDKAKEHITATATAIVCEGYTDVISLHEHGFKNAVAALGTSFSIDHVRTLARFATLIICMFDGDAAGQKAAERAVQYIDKSEADIRCVVLPDNLDPDEFFETHSIQEMEEVLSKARPLMRFVLDKRLDGIDPTTSAGVRKAKLNEIARILAPLKDSVVIGGYALDVASQLGMESDAVMSAIRAATPIRTQEPYQANAYSNQSTTRSGGYNQQQRGPAPASSYYDAPPTGIYPEEAGSYVPDDYIPAEAQDAEYISTPTYTEPVALTADERVQLTAERELLGMMATDIDAFRPSAERIASLAWADESHEAMAWAMLATPVGATPAEVVQAAMVVTPDATKILSSGRVASTSELNEEGKVAFVLDTVELYSTRRKIAVLRARIRNGDGNVTELFSEATELQRQASQLLVRLQETTAGSR